jgi:hypothetical protein
VTVSVRQAPAEHLPWLAERAQINLHPGVLAIEAVNEQGRIVAMVGYERHYVGACMMHVAIDHPAALRHVLRPGFRLAFDKHPHGFGCAEVFAPVRDDNRASLLLVEHLGFKKFHYGKDWMGQGVGLVWFGMRRGECRFLGKDGE